MRINTLSDRLIYVPNRLSGSALFAGQALPSSEVFDELGQEGVEYIQNRIQEILECRKSIFGNENMETFGLFPEQRFLDLKKRILVRVSEVVDINASQKELLLLKNSSHDMEEGDYILTLENQLLYPNIHKMSNKLIHKVVMSGTSRFSTLFPKSDNY